MTDLLTRPARDTSAGSHRTLAVEAMLAALMAAVVGIGLSMALAVVGWFLADAGSHGSTTDALRIGVDAWLIGHGSHTVAGGTPIGMLPLGLVAVLVLIGFRCGARAGRRTSAVSDRLLGTSAGLAVTCYLVIALLLGVLNSRDGADVSLPSLLLGSVAVGVLGLGSGLAWSTGRAQAWLERVPRFVVLSVEGALSAALVMLAAGAVTVAIALLWSFNDASMLMSSMRLGVGDAITLILLLALFAPNAAVMAATFLIGPGFAVGTGTTVSPADVTLGPLPNVPLLAALPQAALPTWAAASMMALPVLIAGFAAARAQSRYRVLAWDSAALRGFAVGLGAGVVLTLAAALSGGAMGTGRLSDVGPSAAEVFVVAVAGMSIGGLVGGLATTAWQRWRDRRQTHEPVR